MSAAIQSPASRTGFPRRIVCLTAETTETLYLLGEQDRIIGVSGFTTRPRRPGSSRVSPRSTAPTAMRFLRWSPTWC